MVSHSGFEAEPYRWFGKRVRAVVDPGGARGARTPYLMVWMTDPQPPPPPSPLSEGLDTEGCATLAHPCNKGEQGWSMYNKTILKTPTCTLTLIIASNSLFIINLYFLRKIGGGQKEAVINNQ